MQTSSRCTPDASTHCVIQDYWLTPVSAEITNTLTNLLFVVLSLLGARSCLRNNHDRIFLVTFAGYAAVGCGSFLFHSTLKYPMQLVDELSMIYTTCISCYSSFTYKRSRVYALAVALALSGLAVFITGYYHYLQDPTFHQRMYALLTATVLFRGFYVMESNLRPGRAVRASKPPFDKPGLLSPMERARLDARDRAILNRMWSMVFYGLTVFLGGFAIWQLDNVYCGTIRRWRREIGLPWGILLEGHGWWHLMTGTGAYFYIVWGIWLRHCMNGKADEYELVWPRLLLSLPEVQLKRSPPGTRRGEIVDGEAKKAK
ncbi:MAG: hypothetical protein Q9162_003642 [Coniocarpon cinnabarinum]